MALYVMIIIFEDVSIFNCQPVELMEEELLART